MSIDVKSERVQNGGFAMSAHVSDWELTQSMPRLIVDEITKAIAKRFVEENGDLLLDLVKDRELLATALKKEIDYRVRTYWEARDKQNKR